jgi:ferric-dicitrate binding protein FerR (iron transport regulator)
LFDREETGRVLAGAGIGDRKTMKENDSKFSIESALLRLQAAGCAFHVRRGKRRVRVTVPAEGMGLRSWAAADFLVLRGHEVEPPLREDGDRETAHAA